MKPHFITMLFLLVTFVHLASTSDSDDESKSSKSSDSADDFEDPVQSSKKVRRGGKEMKRRHQAICPHRQDISTRQVSSVLYES